jgi:hypothetical protein
MKFFDVPESYDDGLKEACRQAVARAHAAGLPTYHADREGMYRQLPDGTIERLLPGDSIRASSG